MVDADIILLSSILNSSEEICLTALQVLHGLSAIQERYSNCTISTWVHPQVNIEHKAIL